MISNTKISCILILLTLSLNTIHVLADDSDNKDEKDSNKKDSGSDETFLVSCGDQNEVEDSSGRKWAPDAKFLNSSSDFSSTEELNKTDPTLPSEDPYKSARIFNATSSYIFSVTTTKRLWIRLHFYPFEYSKIDPTKAYFSVSANEFTLLKNYSAFTNAAALTMAYIVKEFSLTPSTCGKLNITFTPSPQPEGAIAFINGIEVIPMPDVFKTTPLVGFHDQTLEIQNSSVQTMYRVNVGGEYVSPTDDAGGNRTWYEDGGYLVGSPNTKYGVISDADSNNVTINYDGDASECMAPEPVYKTSRSMGPSPNVNLNTNLTWVFDVDANFTYVVRLHFCDFELEKTNQRVFDIYLNNHTAEESADVIAWAGGKGSSGKGVTVFKDYAIYLNDRNNGNEQIWVALHPSEKTQPEYYDALLNGLEVFKINDTCGNFGSDYPVPVRHYSYSEEFLEKTKECDAQCKLLGDDGHATDDN